MEHQSEFTGVQITETYLRNYEQGDLAAQILGYVGEISPSSSRPRPTRATGRRPHRADGARGGLRPYLRGVRGEGRVLVDALGRITSEREFSQLPEAGDNIRLTIDVDLQRAAEEALAYGVRLAHDQDEWAANGGALVAMDVDTGEILALASNPTFDPDIYVGRVEEKDLKRLAARKANLPTMNRAIAGGYPPGSTFKPFVALAAMQEGLLRQDEYIQCTGEEEIDGQIFSNWDPYKNEPMTVSTALANSCDTFFYQLALRFYERKDSPSSGGRGAWASARAQASISGRRPRARPHADLASQDVQERDRQDLDERRLRPALDRPGRPPGQSAADDARVRDDRQRRKLVEPHLVKSVEEPRAEGEPRSSSGRTRRSRPWRSASTRTRCRSSRTRSSTRPMRYGTSQHVFGSFPVEIAGKTGTAEKFVKLPGFRARDQSWWCGYGPYGKPELAVCALIENGGHGGTAAAPVALKVFEKYFNVEPGTYSAVIQQSD